MLDQLVELELGVGNDSAGTAFLVLKDTVFQGDDRSGPADSSNLSLLSKSARKIKIVDDETDLVHLTGSTCDVGRLDDECAIGV